MVTAPNCHSEPTFGFIYPTTRKQAGKEFIIQEVSQMKTGSSCNAHFELILKCLHSEIAVWYKLYLGFMIPEALYLTRAGVFQSLQMHFRNSLHTVQLLTLFEMEATVTWVNKWQCQSKCWRLWSIGQKHPPHTGMKAEGKLFGENEGGQWRWRREEKLI